VDEPILYDIYWQERDPNDPSSVTSRRYRPRFDNVFDTSSPKFELSWLDKTGDGLKISYSGAYEMDHGLSTVYGDESSGSIKRRKERTDLSAAYRLPLAATGFHLEAEAKLRTAVQSTYPLTPAGNAPLWQHNGGVPYTWMNWGRAPQDWEFDQYLLPAAYKWWEDKYFNPFFECPSDGYPNGTPSSIQPAYNKTDSFAFLPEDGPEMPVGGWRQGGIGLTPDARLARYSIGFKLDRDVSYAGRHNVALSVEMEKTSLHYRARYTADGPAPYTFYSRPNPGSNGFCHEYGRYLEIPGTGGFSEVNYTGNWHNLAFGVYTQPESFNQTFVVQGDPMKESDPKNIQAMLDRAIDTTATSNTWTVGLSDQFEPLAIPGLTGVAALNWIPQALVKPNGDTGLAIYDNLAPRLGAFYSPPGDSKTFFSAFGRRVYEPLPMALYTRAFSREARILRNVSLSGQWRDLPDPDNPGTFDPWIVQGGREFAVARTDTKREVQYLASGIRNRGITTEGTGAFDVQGQHYDEFRIAMQHELAPLLSVRAFWTRKILRQVIEDMSLDAGESYIIGNPGRGALQSAYVFDTASRGIKTVDGTMTGAPVEFRYPKPQRNQTELQIGLTKRAGPEGVSLEGVYWWTRSIGNIPAPAGDPDDELNVPFDPIYDLPELTVNRNGPLPDDLTHKVWLSGTWKLPVWKLGNVQIRVDQLYHTGAPINVRGPHSSPQYSSGTVYILPRGAGGRLPDYKRTDIGFSWEYPMANGRVVTLGTRIYNIFNRQGVVRVNERFTTYALTSVQVGGKGGVLPIEGGTLADLPRADEPNGVGTLRSADKTGKLIQGASVSPTYGTVIEYQSPRALSAELSVSF